MNKTELKPIYDSAKSFYGKATQRQNGANDYTLYSYNTAVCRVINNCVGLNIKVAKKKLFSNTTLRHIKEFVRQHTDRIVTKKDLVEILES